MTTPFSEASAEQAARAWLEYVGYRVLPADAANAQRVVDGDTDYSLAVLPDRLHLALITLNPSLSPQAIESAEQAILRPIGTTTIDRNRAFCAMLRDGVPVETKSGDGSRRTQYARVIDAESPSANEFLAISQFLVRDRLTRKVGKPDIVLFVNGLPLVVIELKDPGNAKTSWHTAYRQIRRYHDEIPSLFEYNALSIASDGMFARFGSLTADESRYAPWRTIDGVKLNPKGLPELETMIRGLLQPEVLLDLLTGFTFFEEQVRTSAGGQAQRAIVKKVAGYHQYHAVKKTVVRIAQAMNETTAPRRGGVVWHTQGSGKSITMLMLAGQLVTHPMMQAPTIVVVTDRAELDDQLYGQFSAAKELLRIKPARADSRADLTRLLNTTTGGIVFTTIQKFDESQAAISDRSNIVVLADEAHRTQYGFEDGFARKLKDALPQAVKVGFTGTPVSLEDRNTRNIFGEYVDVYDMRQAVEDEATVRIHLQNRTVPLSLSPVADYKAMYEDALRELGLTTEAARGKVELEDLVGAPARLVAVAKLIVEHFEKREQVLRGKAMVVCMSREIAAKLYDEIIKLRPAWHNDADDAGTIKVVMTGSSNDPPPLDRHARTDGQRASLAERFKDHGTSFKIAIVCDMWLTGFDVPCLHTIYIDKPLAGHTLMQAIARVNRVFGNKPSGLVVDLLGIAPGLRDAMKTYAQYDATADILPDQASLVPVLHEKFGLAIQCVHGLDYSAFFSGNAAEQQRIVRAGADHVLTLPDGKRRFLDILASLSKAFAMVVPLPEADAIVKELSFLQAVGAVLRKTEPSDDQSKPKDALDDSAAVRQVIAGSIVSGDVVDIFALAGLKNAAVDLFDQSFLDDLQAMPQRNLAFEVLRKLLTDQIRSMARTSLVKSREFGEALEKAINRYKLRPLEVAAVMSELVRIAKEITAEPDRAAKLKLSTLELAFYDALAKADGVEALQQSGELRALAHELTDRIRSRAGIDWETKDNVRAEMRAIVKRLLRKYKYPPTAHDKATEIVMEQAERMAEVLSEPEASQSGLSS